MKNPDWYVYIVECVGGSLYTGISNNVVRRIEQHNSGNGAKSIVKSKRPVKLVHLELHEDRSSASKREAAIKKFTRSYKLKLIQKSVNLLNSEGFTLKKYLRSK